jgi:ketosteroid isomerase-like protein
MPTILCAPTFALLLAIFGFAPASAQTDVEQVSAASEAWEEAYNNSDVDLLIQQYTDDAVSMIPNAPASIGRDAIKADIGAFLEAHDTNHSTEIQEILVEGDLAVEYGNYIDEISPKDGSASFTDRGKHIVVYPRGPIGSKATHENQHDEDDQYDADDADAAVTEPIAVAAEAATEATKQENDEQDDEYESNRHDLLPLRH